MKKNIRMLVTCMIEVQTDLPVDEAVQEFEQNSAYQFPDTINVKVIDTEWRETNKVSYTQVNKNNTEVILKPLK